MISEDIKPHKNKHHTHSNYHSATITVCHVLIKRILNISFIISLTHVKCQCYQLIMIMSWVLSSLKILMEMNPFNFSTKENKFYASHLIK